jgi:hypothetical protein
LFLISFIIVPRFAEVFGFKLCLISSSVKEAGKSKTVDIVSSLWGSETWLVM